MAWHEGFEVNEGEGEASDVEHLEIIQSVNQSVSR